MEKNTIKVFARLKPSSKQTNDKIYDIYKKQEYHELTFNKTDENVDILCNKNKPLVKYRFHHIFQEYSIQREVFELVAKPVVNSVFEGFNGTIFAYGQTGCGKTYSMRGNPDDSDKKGIIPRTLQYIFNYIKQSDKIYTILISYMEIYNEIAYDLLKISNTLTLEELPRVVFLEDGDGDLNIRNLRIESIVDEKEAMQLLKLGESNRKVAETPLNPRSSRSHCVFTIYVSGFADDGTVRRSKLHLVDLAGSERVYKSCLTGLNLTEALNINLSLHFLEQVILALSEPKRTHIPYRNSVMTTLLKDSLGGNCMAVMLAAISTDLKHVHESISTCKFSQRVAMVKTTLSLNNDIDPHEEIISLKMEIESLKKQLTSLKKNYCAVEPKEEPKKDLTKEEIKQCTNQLQLFLEGSPSEVSETTDSRKTKFYLQKLRDEVLSQNKSQPEVIVTPQEKKLDSKRKIDKELKGYEKYIQVDLNDKEKEAFKIVMDDPKNMVEINMHIATLKEKYANAKTIADRVEQCKQNVVNLKKRIENCTSLNIEERKGFERKLKIHENIYEENVAELQKIKKETDVIKQNIDKAKVVLITKTREIVKKKEEIEKNSSKFLDSSLYQKQEFITNNLMCEVFHDRRYGDKYFDYPEKLYSKDTIKEMSNEGLLNNKLSSSIDQIKLLKKSQLDDIKYPPDYGQKFSGGMNFIEPSKDMYKQNFDYPYRQQNSLNERYSKPDKNYEYDGRVVPQRPYSSYNNYLSQNEDYMRSINRSRLTPTTQPRDYFEAEKYNQPPNYPDDLRLSGRKDYEEEERLKNQVYNERINSRSNLEEQVSEQYNSSGPPINVNYVPGQLYSTVTMYQGDKNYLANDISPKPQIPSNAYHPEQFRNYSPNGSYNSPTNVQSVPYKPTPPPINIQRDYYGIQKYHQERGYQYPNETLSTSRVIEPNFDQNFRNEAILNDQQKSYQKYHQERGYQYPNETLSTLKGIERNFDQNFRNEVVPNDQQKSYQKYDQEKSYQYPIETFSNQRGVESRFPPNVQFKSYQNMNEINSQNISNSKDFQINNNFNQSSISISNPSNSTHNGQSRSNHFTDSLHNNHYIESHPCNNHFTDTQPPTPNEILIRNNPTENNTNTNLNYQNQQNNSDPNRTTENVCNTQSTTTTNPIPNNQDEITEKQELRYGDIPLTGDPDVDAEIIAFYKSRD